MTCEETSNESSCSSELAGRSICLTSLAVFLAMSYSYVFPRMSGFESVYRIDWLSMSYYSKWVEDRYRVGLNGEFSDVIDREQLLRNAEIVVVQIELQRPNAISMTALFIENNVSLSHSSPPPLPSEYPCRRSDTRRESALPAALRAPTASAAPLFPAGSTDR